MQIKEELGVVIKHHPYYEIINKKIVEEFNTLYYTREMYNSDGGKTNVKALQTDNNIKTPTLSLIEQWVIDEMRIYDQLSYEIKECWAVKYNKDDYTISHHHKCATYAFVYFVKTPHGSSPLVFTTSGKKIKAEEGKLIIFPGFLRHKVPKNRCDGRMTIAGNLYHIR